MSEHWKQIGAANGYEVSDLGRVRSIDRIRASDNARIKGRILKPSVVRGGYHQVRLSVSAVVKNFFVHRLVLEVFEGPCPAGMEGCHGDGNPANNALSNLRWDTPKANCFQRIEHGTLARGERAGRAKLSVSAILSIREQRRAGVSARELARKHQVTVQHVMLIVRGGTWKHLYG